MSFCQNGGIFHSEESPEWRTPCIEFNAFTPHSVDGQQTGKRRFIQTLFILILPSLFPARLIYLILNQNPVSTGKYRIFIGILIFFSQKICLLSPARSRYCGSVL
ncbi:MAG: hypothetical protein JO200_08400 [Comamonas sp.]|nr:hypothetical protein [Comamonas sp.]